jgi:hypothetical protein
LCYFYIMARIQIQLPDELYQRAKRVAAERGLSLAALARRGLELFLARCSDAPASEAAWSLPVVRCGGIKVPLGRLRKIAAKGDNL